MRAFVVVLASLTLPLSACATAAPVEEVPEREFFVEPEEREPTEPRDPEPPASATATGSSIHQVPEAPSLESDPSPPPEDTIPIPEDPVTDDPFYRPPGMDPCEENAYGYVANDACLEQQGVPRDS